MTNEQIERQELTDGLVEQAYQENERRNGWSDRQEYRDLLSQISGLTRNAVNLRRQIYTGRNDIVEMILGKKYEKKDLKIYLDKQTQQVERAYKQARAYEEKYGTKGAALVELEDFKHICKTIREAIEE